MFCKNCGEQIADAAVLCVKCGVPTDKAKPAVDESKPMTQGELVGGWLGAIFLPIIGLIVGIVALTRGRIGTGIGMIALSIIMCFFWAGFMSAL